MTGVQSSGKSAASGRTGRARRPVLGAAALAMLASTVQPLVLAPSATAAAPSSVASPSGKAAPKTAATLEAAQKAAEVGGANVEIASLRSESSEVYATPDGQLVEVQHLRPVRTRSGGQWKTIDNTLVQSANGAVRPNAASVGLAFSGGGKGPLVTLNRTGKELSYSWPTALPTPTLSGDTATYKDVLPDVDLKMRATTDGFSQLLVVKSPEAARNPALAELKLAVESPGLDLRATESGGLEAIDEGTDGIVFQIPGQHANRLSPDELWEANQRFLDRGIRNGDSFRLSTPVDRMRADSGYEREVNYLLSNGYTFNSAGDALIPRVR